MFGPDLNFLVERSRAYDELLFRSRKGVDTVLSWIPQVQYGNAPVRYAESGRLV